jgi:hypothetical protein
MRKQASPCCHQKVPCHILKYLSNPWVMNTTDNYENGTNHDKPPIVLDGTSSQQKLDETSFVSRPKIQIVRFKHWQVYVKRQDKCSTKTHLIVSKLQFLRMKYLLFSRLPPDCKSCISKLTMFCTQKCEWTLCSRHKDSNPCDLHNKDFRATVPDLTKVQIH